MKLPMDTVRENLCGNFYNVFSIGDIFTLRFPDCTLIAHEIRIEQEEAIDKAACEALPILGEAVDRVNIAKAAVLAATQRSDVTSAELMGNSSLALAFENGIKLLFPTDTDIVDWQWALTKSGGCPYDRSEFIAGVFGDNLET